MGKKGGWFSVLRKAVSPSCSKKKKDKRSHKSSPRKSWQENQMSLDTYLSQNKAELANPPHHNPPLKDTELKEPDNEPIKLAFSTPMVEEEPVTTAEVVRKTSTPRFVGKSTEEIAAIMIQTAYRGHLARRGMRPLRGMRRLKLLVQGQSVNRQSASALRHMQTLSRVQSQVRARRIRMSEVNQALQRQLRQKHEKELGKAKSFQQESGWDLSPRSKEQVEASLRRKKEAAERRERVTAYAHIRQQTWRKSLESENPWGWSWSEQWNAVRPWESGTACDKEMGKKISSPSPSKALSKGGGGSSPAAARVQKGSKRPGPSPLGSGKKGGSNTGLGVGSAKKRPLLSGSSSSKIRKGSNTGRV